MREPSKLSSPQALPPPLRVWVRVKASAVSWVPCRPSPHLPTIRHEKPGACPTERQAQAAVARPGFKGNPDTSPCIFPPWLFRRSQRAAFEVAARKGDGKERGGGDGGGRAAVISRGGMTRCHFLMSPERWERDASSPENNKSALISASPPYFVAFFLLLAPS